MPRHPGSACKKRPHPDELHLNSSLPKRLLSIPGSAELGSGLDSAHDLTIPTSSTLNTPQESFWNSASSALINSDYSMSTHPDQSSMSADAASSKPEGPGTAHAHTPSDGASYHLADLKSTGDPKGIWTYRSGSSKREGIESEAELSEVTVEKSAYTLSSAHNSVVISGSGKATHVISRRNESGLNSKPGMGGLWHKGAYGYAGHKGSYGYGGHVSRGMQLESISTLYSARPRREDTFSSGACETGSSCATGDSSMEEIRSNHGFSDISQFVCKEASMAHVNNQATAEVLVGPRVHERSGCTDYQIIQSAESGSHPHMSSIHKAATEEPSPSYVLSSGRLSLEEEAKLGRRAPTIDRDFEEYFSSLML
eukprot:c23331_g1_i4 orf=101-1204(-)